MNPPRYKPKENPGLRTASIRLVRSVFHGPQIGPCDGFSPRTKALIRNLPKEWLRATTDAGHYFLRSNGEVVPAGS